MLRACAENQQLDFSLFICFGCVSFSSLSHLIPFRNLLSLGIFFPIILPAVFSPLLYLGSVVFIFFLQLFPPSTVSFSLFIIPSCFSPLCHFHLLPPLSLLLLLQNKADIVWHDESCWKVKYHYPSDCHLDVLEILLGFFLFFWFEKAFGCFHTQTHNGLF